MTDIDPTAGDSAEPTAEPAAEPISVSAEEQTFIGTLTQRLRVQSVRITSGWAPLEVEGVLEDGRPFHFHARHGVASLAVAAPGGDPIAAPTQAWEQQCSHGLGLDSAVLAAETFMALHASAATTSRRPRRAG